MNAPALLKYLFGCCLLFSISCKKDSGPDKEEEKPVKEDILYAVRGNQPGIFDKDGRFVLLRGVNYNVLGDYWQANPEIPATAPYDADQFRIMASYGFNCVRLLFSWSLLEPQPGQYNQDYIGKINQAILDAQQHGIYIMLDLHQDAYGKYIATPKDVACELPGKGWDGAPQWATLTDDASTCRESGDRESAPAVYHAWQNLWDNKNGIQDNLINAWAALISKVGHHKNVLGYDLINEPSLGYSSLKDQQNKLSTFYGQLIRKIRETEKQNGIAERIVFFEPAVTFAGQQIPAVVGSNFTNDNNIVFAPHNYFEVITTLLTVEQGYTLYSTLAKAYQAYCLIGEWGVYDRPEEGVAKLKRFAQQEDQYLMGSTIWQWSQAPGDPHSISWDGKTYEASSLHMVEVSSNGMYTGVRNTVFLKVLGRARPLAVHGKSINFTSDPDSGIMKLSANADQPGITEVWIPDFFGTPKISGTNSTLTKLETVEGGYKASLEVKDKYTIEIGY